ncbi:MAG: hypothetical protein HLUCCO18_06250 [Rhodobacteraceae bacterium HLUCCO18]|nr:MAG: hypothetical protein HLUCCO18_06250 [Rhodobacteraceae bacterium HLUCCO18]
MFYALITALFAGLAGAGIGLGLRALSGKRLPKGIIPICAGLAMLVATVGTEYAWYDGVRSTMPEDLVIVSEREQQAWYQPWTFVRPWVRGFIGYSPSETVETAEGSGIYVVQLRGQERWQPQVIRPNLVDCEGGRRAEILPDTGFTETGEPVGVTWREVPEDDPILSAVCGGGAAAG